MFRDGQYLEVIKASDNCLATAVVTVQERTVEIRRKKVITNKWLQVEDWAALYKILERAILKNSRGEETHGENRGSKWRKSTRQLEVTYTFEPPECTGDTMSLPTIKVHVSPAKKKSAKGEASGRTSRKNGMEINDATAKQKAQAKFLDLMTDAKSNRSIKIPETPIIESPKKATEAPHIGPAERNDERDKRSRRYMLSDDTENDLLEEYIPNAPKAKNSCTDFKYVPSRKSTLESMRVTSNEYTPTLCDSEHLAETVNYVPNSVEKLEATYETYEPRATTIIPDGILQEYIPNSKGVKASIEEYEPDFKSTSKLMKFDDSYVPSRVLLNDSQITGKKYDKLKMQRLKARRKGALSKKQLDLLS